MNKENIIIKSIIPSYETITYVGQEPTTKQIGLSIEFDYKNINDSRFYFSTNKIDVEEIKDKIMPYIVTGKQIGRAHV